MRYIAVFKTRCPDMLGQACRCSIFNITGSPDGLHTARCTILLPLTYDPSLSSSLLTLSMQRRRCSMRRRHLQRSRVRGGREARIFAAPPKPAQLRRHPPPVQ